MDINNYNNLMILKDGNPTTPLFYDDDAKRYIKMEYVSRFTNWNMTAGNTKSNSNYSEAV